MNENQFKAALQELLNKHGDKPPTRKLVVDAAVIGMIYKSSQYENELKDVIARMSHKQKKNGST